MGKNNRCGQAAILSDAQFKKLRSAIKNEKHQMIFDVAWWTGERLGAIVQLKVEDVYSLDGWPRDSITFRAHTRKARPNGIRDTRQVYLHPTLKSHFQHYGRPAFGFLFPGRDENSHISFDAMDDVLRRAITRARLEHVGISTHSFRRSFATAIAQKGVSVRELMTMMGWKDPKVAMRYIEANPQRLKQIVMLR
jgi:integrase/recombinase XerD